MGEYDNSGLGGVGNYSARHVARIAVGSGATGLVIGLVGSSFSAAGVINMTVAAAMLLIAWVAGIVAITVSEPVWGLPSRYRLVATASTVALLTLLLGSIGWFQYLHFPVADRGTARLHLLQLSTDKRPNDGLARFGASVVNDGNAIAFNTIAIVAGKLTPTLLTADQIEAARKKLVELDRDAEKGGPTRGQVFPQTSQFVHLSDIDSLPFAPGAESVITATDAQLQDFNNGRLALYVFLLVRYEDETLGERAFWESSSCSYFIGTFAYWHSCWPPKIEKITERRFR